ncbi:MAG: DNA-3-methyladenine glycosylase I [Apilactobacillus sp.]|uniref:DNA-3-methyladenine glycosylase I n=1 Tax=Apilactobacillus TaxID=2767877 RepID=UPI0025DC5A80|nr:DNA-3-methyladenine glycosylase I [Apilactobacillus sp.]MCT6822975.1 DNA-3-methyladenine glycosylase I [Apilactobacillus sp.]MCT6858722.1 DNA-3-methyladenine glycosylase I [Apilactobacillus sp.]
MNRCKWANENTNMLIYHDNEWGVKKYDISELFESLTLEIFQAGLSWQTVLNKRNAFKEAFCSFDIRLISEFTEEDIIRLLQNPAIIRNRAKIEATIKNAKCCLENDLCELTWHPFDFKTMDGLNNGDKIGAPNFVNEYVKTFKNKGFKRVGLTTMYSYLQSVGVINDHELSCFRHDQLIED